MITASQLRPVGPAGVGVEVEATSETGSVLAEVLLERSRQIDQEGYGPAHDDAHDFAELARFAAAHCFASAALAPALQGEEQRANRAVMQSNARNQVPPGFVLKPIGSAAGGQRRHLVIAAALLIAEIERIDRAS